MVCPLASPHHGCVAVVGAGPVERSFFLKSPSAKMLLSSASVVKPFVVKHSTQNQSYVCRQLIYLQVPDVEPTYIQFLLFCLR